jgi:hypothetical protein
MVAAVLAAWPTRADDVTWVTSVPLWKSLSPTGQLLDAGPAPNWQNAPPAMLGAVSRPVPVEAVRPQSLPSSLAAVDGPTLPPPAKPAAEPRPRPKRESFASARVEPAEPVDEAAARLAPPRP